MCGSNNPQSRIKRYPENPGKMSGDELISCGPCSPGMTPSVPDYALSVKNSADNIWRDENLVPVLSEDDEVYVIDNV